MTREDYIFAHYTTLRTGGKRRYVPDNDIATMLKEIKEAL